MASLWLQLLKTPGLTGAVMPSSRHLAQAMACAAGAVPHVVELGAGTGAVTQALCTRLPQASLVAVEIQPQLADALRDRFDGLDVREAAAHEVLRHLRYAAPTAVVSSLPFRSLPHPLREATQDSITSFLRRTPQSLLVQYTYLPHAPFEVPPEFQWHLACMVWRNVPPAGVWILEYRP